MLNKDLILNPFNWIIVALMLIIAGIGASLVCEYFHEKEVQ